MKYVVGGVIISLAGIGLLMNNMDLAGVVVLLIGLVIGSKGRM